MFRGVVFEMTEENILGQGAQGIVYRGKWHGFDAAFKASELQDKDDTKNDPMAALKMVGEMQNKMKEVYELIDLKKTFIDKINFENETENQENSEKRENKKTETKRNNGIKWCAKISQANLSQCFGNFHPPPLGCSVLNQLKCVDQNKNFRTKMRSIFITIGLISVPESSTVIAEGPIWE